MKVSLILLVASVGIFDGCPSSKGRPEDFQIVWWLCRPRPTSGNDHVCRGGDNHAGYRQFYYSAGPTKDCQHYLTTEQLFIPDPMDEKQPLLPDDLTADEAFRQLMLNRGSSFPDTKTGGQTLLRNKDCHLHWLADPESGMQGVCFVCP